MIFIYSSTQMIAKNNIIKRDSAEIENILRKHGLSPTSQRIAIANLILVENIHITADQLHVRLRENGLLISKATVYNTLGIFVISGLLKEIYIDSNCTYYDSNISCHHHIYNIDSGELSDISQPVDVSFDPSILANNTIIEEVEVVFRVRNQL